MRGSVTGSGCRSSIRRSPAYDVDDVLDACAVAWTARRHLRGESRALPEVPERFSDGLAAAIHV
jgi:hypothetical protein